MTEQLSRLRSLREVVEPVAASAYFTPEPLQALASLGLGPLEAYFCGRSAPLGRLSPGAAVALFAFFKPDVVERSIESGWTKTTPEAAVAARLEGVAKAIRRVLDSVDVATIARSLEPLERALHEVPSYGRPFFEGWRRAEVTKDDPYLYLWWVCDLFREHRGAAHTAAWMESRLGACDVVVLSKAWWGMADDTYLRVHGWNADDVASATSRLENRGLLEGGKLTAEGIRLRDRIEARTDQGQLDLFEAVGERTLQVIEESLKPACEAALRARAYPMPKVPSRAV